MMRFDDLVRGGAPDAPALLERNRQLSYAELDALVSAMAARLSDEGLRPGDRVAVYANKTLETAAALFAVARADGVFVPVNPVLKPPQVAHILADSGAALLWTTAPRASLLEGEGALGPARPLPLEAAQPLNLSAKTPPPLNLSAADAHGPDFSQTVNLSAHDPDHPIFSQTVNLSAPDPNAPHLSQPVNLSLQAAQTADPALAAILYTSGSTGRPKGVMLSHRNLFLGAHSVATYLGITPQDRALAALPLSFDYGLNQLTNSFLAGSSVVLLDYLTGRDVVRAVERHRVTTLAGVPPLWIQLAEAQWPEAARASLRRLTNTGGRMPVALTRRLQALFPSARIFLMYGLTEAFRSTYLDPALVDARPTSIGKAVPHAEVLVVRPDGSLTDPGEPGELVHVGPLVAQGYWNDPDRTAQRFRPAPPAAATGPVGVWSGDTVVRDAEGFLTYVGRDDEMIKTSGNRVSPTEVEEAAYATGAIAEAAAFGVEDERLGQAILLVATPRPGEAPDETALKRRLAELVPAYMMPRRILWRDQLPRNPNGKIDRAALGAELA